MRLWKRKLGNKATHQETQTAGGQSGGAKSGGRAEDHTSGEVDRRLADMVTTIKATCNACGDVSLKDHEVTLRICLDNNQGSYRFKCPECKCLVLKPADAVTVRLLSNTEVQLESWTLPLELSEPRPGGEQLSLDDVLAMHELLEEPTRFEEDLHESGDST